MIRLGKVVAARKYLSLVIMICVLCTAKRYVCNVSNNYERIIRLIRLCAKWLHCLRPLA